MRMANADAALVVQDETISPGSIVGIIGGEQIAKTVSQGTEYFQIVNGTIKNFLNKVRGRLKGLT
jgi:hypothetical protein